MSPPLFTLCSALLRNCHVIGDKHIGQPE
ncbi:hypothetical protein KP509_05G010800 [Ceratopteris richardii]|nr:hypothetical protein KP509_05G010800 [Ceratopteris richardii]